ncbi:hypothetical protein C6P46_003026, partial [Rhodotorula mucilaginosa]
CLCKLRRVVLWPESELMVGPPATFAGRFWRPRRRHDHGADYSQEVAPPRQQGI